MLHGGEIGQLVLLLQQALKDLPHRSASATAGATSEQSQQQLATRFTPDAAELRAIINEELTR